MLFHYEAPSSDERRVLDRIEKMRHDLRYYVAQSPRRWTGLLARLTRARAMRASNSIEGINISAEDAIAVVDNEEPGEADKATWQAVEGYRSAMDYILQRCRDDSFFFSVDVLLAIHFMISQHDLDANPGNIRPGWVCVRNSVTGDIVHEGVDRDALEPLIGELIDYLNDHRTPSIIVKAAMVHLNIAMLHPFSRWQREGRTLLADRGPCQRGDRGTVLFEHRRVYRPEPAGLLRRSCGSRRRRMEPSARQPAVGAILHPRSL